MPTLAIIGITLFVVGYLIPAAIEIYEKTQAKDALDDRVSLFSIRADWFTAFSALAAGMSGFLIYIWTGGKIALSLLDRELATIVVLAGSASAFLSFVIMKWLEGILMVLGYMWDNTVVARRKRIAAKAKAEGYAAGREEGQAEGRAEGREEWQAKGRAEGRAEMQKENARLKARIAELEQNRNGDAE